ncbi:Uncharacterised protein [Mycobacterium tuberculosis]|nr:Uncharacterised protein [Mycobacterium tuberculosis]
MMVLSQFCPFKPMIVPPNFTIGLGRQIFPRFPMRKIVNNSRIILTLRQLIISKLFMNDNMIIIKVQFQPFMFKKHIQDALICLIHLIMPFIG